MVVNVKMARLSTCKGCSTKLQSTEKYTYSGKTYCINCYNKLVQENEQRNLLITSICTNLNLEFLTGSMLKQLKDYRETCNYTYAGMNYTLWYYTNILNKSLQVKYGLAFIKYYYEEAKQYFLQQSEIKKALDDANESNIKTKIITVSKKNNVVNNLLDLNTLCGGKDHEI